MVKKVVSCDFAGAELSFHIIKNAGMLKCNTLIWNFYWTIKNIKQNQRYPHRTGKKKI